MTGEPATPSSLNAGDIIDQKFIVERILGQGGMGIVAAARPVQGGDPVALKLLLREALVIPDAVDRFYREARTLARLTSEHVVRVHDVGRLDTGLPYMAMELLEGQSLDEIVKSQGPLPIQDACAYIAEACEALAEAHALGIVHRDIKPANLFRATRAAGFCVKVIDFGIAKELDSSGPKTQNHMVMGSVAHMPPEQLRAAKHAEQRSDIWAVGATLFELLTAKHPFSAPSLPQLIVTINCDPPRSPRSLRPEIPPGLEALLLRCLEKKPEKRFQSMQELLTALRPYAAGEAPAEPAPLPATPAASTPPAPPAPRSSSRADRAPASTRGPRSTRAPRSKKAPRASGPASRRAGRRARPGAAGVALAVLLVGLLAAGLVALVGRPGAPPPPATSAP